MVTGVWMCNLIIRTSLVKEANCLGNYQIEIGWKRSPVLLDFRWQDTVEVITRGCRKEKKLRFGRNLMVN